MTQAGVSEAFARAVRHHQAGQLREAEALYRQILKREPRHADSLHLSGVIAYQAGRHASAIALIGRAIAIDPAAAAYHSNLGNALQALGRLDEAVASFRRALALQPDYPEAYNNLGMALGELDRLDEAVACCRAAIARRPDYANAYNNLGSLLQKQGTMDEAAASYRRAVALKPDFPAAYNNLGNVLHRGRGVDEAIACYRRALELKSDYAAAHNNLGLALQSQGRFQEAVADSTLAVLLLDGRAEALETEEVVSHLRRQRPELKVIIVSDSVAPEQVQALIGSGAKGLLTKTASENELRMAMDVVLDGSIWAPRKVLAKLIEASSETDDGSGEKRTEKLADLVTPREAEVLQLLTEGCSNREIAHALKIDEVTVKAHLGRMLRKAGVSNRVELTLRALEEQGAFGAKKHS